MSMTSQSNFTLLCELGGSNLRFELPVTSPCHQIKLLHLISDAYCDFLEELKPKYYALAEMVEKGIAGLSQLKDKVEVDKRQHEASCPAPTKRNEAEVRSWVPPKTRRVAFRMEKEVDGISESSESSSEENLPLLKKTWRLWPGDAQNIAKRDPATRRLLQAAPDAVDAEEQDVHSIVPNGRESASSSSSKLLSAMKAVRRASQTTKRVCPM
eukprot:TRINITY_DN23680_c0_g1_i1.p1 TRINITY_DN23680_c0_g1~~TRINITY_DN23680_c0_g1_i1.p1  ORF type:complete len:233 (+),score=42.34 TRINITY_DN23680_c0_g1_i1:66-701(+)